MKKKNQTLRAIAVLLLITMIALVLVSSTYAKYTTEYTGTDSIVVANFTVGSSITDDTISIFDTVCEVDATTSESDVLDERIAPGTGGQFTIEVTNSSEVTVEYSLTITETSNSSNIPIEYSLDGSTYYTASKFATINAATETTDTTSTAKGTLAIGSSSTTKDSVTVYWRWAYEGSSSANYTSSQTDTTDTALGTASTAPSVEVKASVVFIQVD